ncbi:MAG: lysylphosphatidylglycerol synthase transmembrane domain-containing protein [Chloroflexota bacterium]
MEIAEQGKQDSVASPHDALVDELEKRIEPTDAEAERDLAIGNRLGNWKSIVSFGLAVVIFVFVILYLKRNIDPHALWQRLKTLNIGLFLGAFAVYYLTFPLRGFRWKMLLQNAYRESGSHAVDDMSIRGLTEIIYISWFVNCVVPAKLGDLYRAYLAKLWARVSWTKTIGTVMAERIVDILVLSFLLALTGFVAFHNKLGHISTILLLGLGLAAAGITALVLMKTLSARIRNRLPDRFAHKYAAFEEGTLHSFKRVPSLLALTAVIWLLEGGRLQLVFLSLGLHSSHISSVPFAPMLFFALGTAVLTTIPFTPGGLGLVEAGLLGMMIYLGIPKVDAAAVVLVDRVLSYYSVAFFGFLVYLLSKRSHFRHPV